MDFPVSGLDLSSLVKCPDAPEPVYDLYAVSNHFGGMGGGHCKIKCIYVFTNFTPVLAVFMCYSMFVCF